MLSLSAGLFNSAKLFLFCPTIMSDVQAGLGIHELTFHTIRVHVVFKSLRMPGQLGDPDTFETCQYAWFILPPALARVKATLSMKMPVRQHLGE